MLHIAQSKCVLGGGWVVDGWVGDRSVRPRVYATPLTLTLAVGLQVLSLAAAVPHCKGVVLAHDGCGPLVLDPPTSTPGGIPLR